MPYVLFVGRITRQKGVTHLVDAIRYLPPDTQIVLCAGAPDTPEIAAEMRAKVDEARAPNPRIVWIEKMVTSAETIQLYSHARVFCCPSVYEPFGIINLEAMACRAPVVASATGGILEVVVDGETGYLVPFEQDPVTSFPIDPDQFARDLATKLTALLKDPATSQANGRSRPPPRGASTSPGPASPTRPSLSTRSSSSASAARDAVEVSPCAPERNTAIGKSTSVSLDNQ